MTQRTPSIRIVTLQPSHDLGSMLSGVRFCHD